MSKKDYLNYIINDEDVGTTICSYYKKRIDNDGLESQGCFSEAKMPAGAGKTHGVNLLQGYSAYEKCCDDYEANTNTSFVFDKRTTYVKANFYTTVSVAQAFKEYIDARKLVSRYYEKHEHYCSDSRRKQTLENIAFLPNRMISAKLLFIYYDEVVRDLFTTVKADEQVSIGGNPFYDAPKLATDTEAFYGVKYIIDKVYSAIAFENSFTDIDEMSEDEKKECFIRRMHIEKQIELLWASFNHTYSKSSYHDRYTIKSDIETDESPHNIEQRFMRALDARFRERIEDIDYDVNDVVFQNKQQRYFTAQCPSFDKSNDNVKHREAMQKSFYDYLFTDDDVITYENSRDLNKFRLIFANALLSRGLCSSYYTTIHKALFPASSPFRPTVGILKDIGTTLLTGNFYLDEFDSCKKIIMSHIYAKLIPNKDSLGFIEAFTRIPTKIHNRLPFELQKIKGLAALVAEARDEAIAVSAEFSNTQYVFNRERLDLASIFAVDFDTQFMPVVHSDADKDENKRQIAEDERAKSAQGDLFSSVSVADFGVKPKGKKDEESGIKTYYVNTDTNSETVTLSDKPLDDYRTFETFVTTLSTRIHTRIIPPILRALREIDNYVDKEGNAVYASWSTAAKLKLLLSNLNINHNDTDLYSFLEYALNIFAVSLTRKLKKGSTPYSNPVAWIQLISPVSSAMKSASHVNHSLMMTQVETSPEAILLHKLKHANIIGISATVDADTVVENINIEYLKSELLERYVISSEDEKRDIIQNSYMSRRTFIDKVAHHFFVLKDSKIAADEYLNSLSIGGRSISQLATSFYQRLGEHEHTKKSDITKYVNRHRIRMFEIAKTIEYFLTDNNTQSRVALIYMTRGLFTNEKTLREAKINIDERELIEKYLVPAICQRLCIDRTVEVEELLSKQLKRRNTLGKPKLPKRGQARIYFSTFASSGAGHNLQLETHISQIEDYIHLTRDDIFDINSHSRVDVDIDTIAILDATSVAFNKIAEKDEGDISVHDELLMLQRTKELLAAGEICYDTAQTFTSQIAKGLVRGDFRDFKKTQDYAEAVNKQVGQMLPRGDRTTIRNADVKVILSESIAECVSRTPIPDPVVTGYTYNKLREALPLNYTFDTEYARLFIKNENALRQQRKNSKTHINKLISHLSKKNYDKSADVVNDDKFIRETLLRHPTASERFGDFYLEMIEPSSEYYIKDAFNAVRYNKSVIDKDKVSAQRLISDASLRRMCANDTVRDYFKQHNLPTEWQVNPYIISPVYMSTYAGVIGEIAARALLKTYLSIDINNLVDADYEKSDFAYGKTMIDIKNWSQKTNSSIENTQEKIFSTARRKLNNAIDDYDTYLFINIFATETGTYEERIIDNVRCVTVNGLLHSDNSNEILANNFDIINDILNAP